MKLSKYVAAAVVAAAVTGSVAGTAVPVYAAAVSDTISAKQTAINNASQVVPAAAKLVGAKTGEDEFELEYLDPDTLERYEVEVDRATQKVKEVEVKSSNYPGSVTVNKTPEDVKAAITARYPDAKNIVVETVKDDKEGTPFVVYKATFETDAFAGEALLNPATCYIGYQDLEYK
ncbi:MAG: hypothetical protein LKE33_03990 [Acidaminococcus sp.]|jgi:hypothetical protein|nr:hypothetical protein [Acidaminococcus sp.]MCI2100623.1 hypothetical protein [Acidaminococcus sp.]MCI2114944.1 hypothetical protein [Acidaminococcus sp.]MCI2116970.1 hypothetical protein [Acidaminococcus sp.]